MEILSHILG